MHDGSSVGEAAINFAHTVAQEAMFVFGTTSYFGIPMKHPFSAPMATGLVITVTFNAFVLHKLLGEVFSRPGDELRGHLWPR